MKTTELIGPTLDWAVARVENPTAYDEDLVFHVTNDMPLNYSTDWAQGGPIIEREGIDLRKRVPDPDIARPHPRFAWKAELVATNPYFCGTGPTPLVAAMRCFVASKLGDEVEIPEELLPTQLDADKARLAQARRAFDQNPTPPLSTIIRRLAASVARQEKAK